MSKTIGSGQVAHKFLPDFEGKPVLASCLNCAYLEDASDGYESGPSFYACQKNPHMGNLKAFPFKTPQKCCDLDFVYMVDWKEEGIKCQLEHRLELLNTPPTEAGVFT
tara:strand:+ start:1564 stop:1887 length:324 start_codon:yes stop_codon:yes gene_type:complete